MLPSDQVGDISCVPDDGVFTCHNELLAPAILNKTGFTFNICNRTDLVFSTKCLTRKGIVTRLQFRFRMQQY